MLELEKDWVSNPASLHSRSLTLDKSHNLSNASFFPSTIIGPIFWYCCEDESRSCIFTVSVTDFALTYVGCSGVLLITIILPSSRAVTILDYLSLVFSELLSYWPTGGRCAWIILLFICLGECCSLDCTWGQVSQLCLVLFFKIFFKEPAHWVLRNELMTHLYFKEPEVLLILFLMANKIICWSFYPVSLRSAYSNWF